MTQPGQQVRVVGRYALHNAIAAGGMATVHLGRLLGPVGFSRTVAIKRLHAQFAADPEFVSMFLDEARLAARIRHPNVVPTLDVVATQGELFLVMEYVPGESVARLSRALREKQNQFPMRVLSTIITGALHGLHAAHEAKDERGHPLGIVHRDVSPQNVLVGTDGVPRVLDFGVAKAAGRMQTTKEGQIKGKLSYMPPEQLRGVGVSRQTDIYAAGVMLWELLTGQRLFAAENEGAIVAKILEGRIVPPSCALAAGMRMMADTAMRQLEALDRIVLRALAMDPQARFGSAREMAIEIERILPPATASEVGDWVESIARDVLSSRAAMIAEIESSASMPVADGSHLMSMLNGPTLGSAQPVHNATSVTRAAATPPGIGSGSYAYGPAMEGPPVTQPSSISVSSPRVDEVRGRRTAIAVSLGLVMGAALVGSAFAYRFASQRHKEQQNATEPTATTATAEAPRVEADAGAAAATEQPPAPSTPPAVASSSAKATTTAVSPPRNRSTTGPKPMGASTITAADPATSAPGPDCSTPIWYDAQGVKHYKPECMK